MTEELAWLSLGPTLSAIVSASLLSFGVYCVKTSII